ncbi:helix-turn-helix transcriptional regulator [Aquimarina sp. MMG015]|uniref:helix-turn-helix domain-containing protein n=1 Tax=Aquimarina sp. MMG015 TaxID=2822689 RepID=UPI001B3A4C38|nr:helix-turn-helix domain-containing protein [Aquimarina sp. MMG015]MBQ4804988.1 helix-turn-helix transcriptional regulator [Aquimarina sp. MMG015]
MNIEIIKPSDIELQKYIECFYILTHSKEEGRTTYFTFPSIFSMVSISSNTNVVRTNRFIKTTDSSILNFDSNLDTRFTNPLLIQYEGYVKEITTYFKPLGLNAFLNRPLNYYCNSDKTQFLPFLDYMDVMSSILKIASSDKIMKLLENYWSSKLKNDRPLKLEKAIKAIIENPNRSISSIANDSNLSHKTLISHFNKNMCKTPTEFRKIVRFRKTLKNKKENNLTQLSYLSNYFDQAHMIKDFDKLTGYKPKDFFKNLTSIDEKINWIFT